MNDKIKQHKKAEIKKTIRLSQENQNIVVENAKNENCTHNYFINNLIQKASKKLASGSGLNIILEVEKQLLEILTTLELMKVVDIKTLQKIQSLIDSIEKIKEVSKWM